MFPPQGWESVIGSQKFEYVRTDFSVCLGDLEIISTIHKKKKIPARENLRHFSGKISFLIRKNTTIYTEVISLDKSLQDGV